MKRECTEVENRIIKESAADILTYKSLSTSAVRSLLLPIMLGFITGLGLGALISLAFGIINKFWIRVLFIGCCIIMIEILYLFGEGSVTVKVGRIPFRAVSFG